jgi:LPXTG-motif cell wall-anchored protein
MSRSPGTGARRLGAILSAAAATLALSPAIPAIPAHAEAAGRVDAYLSLPPVTVATDGGGKVVVVTVNAQNAVKPVLVIDSAGLGPTVTVAPVEKTGCTTAGTKTTCVLPTGTYDNLHFPLAVRSAAGAKAVDDAGTFTVRGAAQGYEQEATVQPQKVAVADGPDLVARDTSDQAAPAKPGDTVWLPVTFANEGSRTADNVVLTFFFGKGLEAELYDGCTYTPYYLDTMVSCPTGESAEPGEQVTFVTDDGTAAGHPGFAAKVAADAYGDVHGSYTVLPGAEAAKSASLTGHPVSGGKKSRTAVTAQAFASDLNQYDNFADARWNVANVLDIQALASFNGPSTGKVGDVVRVRIGIKNVGRAALYWTSYWSSTWVFSFQAADGTVVSAVPLGNCGWYDPPDPGFDNESNTGRHYYTCSIARDFRPGDEVLLDFALRIDHVVPNAVAAVTMGSTRAVPPITLTDDNPANDTARLVINAGPTGPGGNGGNGGVLPITGTQTAIVAAVGTALLAGGVVLYLLARRRRIILVTPED